MKKKLNKIMLLFAALFMLTPNVASAQYGTYFSGRATRNPKPIGRIMKKYDYAPGVVTLHSGYRRGSNLDFSIRHENGARASQGITVWGNYRYNIYYLGGHGIKHRNYRLYTACSGGSRHVSGRWAP